MPTLVETEKYMELLAMQRRLKEQENRLKEFKVGAGPEESARIRSVQETLKYIQSGK